MKDVMLDLETFGTRPGCVIRSTGAVFFDGQSLGQEFYANVDRASCEKFGLTVDANTVAWWERQSAAAQAQLLVDPLPLDAALWQFNVWWSAHGGVRVWSHGANFDQPIMEPAFAAVGMQSPWSFWNSRCTRTLYDVAGVDTKKATRGGTHHNALDDAKFQAVCAQAAYRRISLVGTPPVVVAPAPTVIVAAKTVEPKGDVFS